MSVRTDLRRHLRDYGGCTVLVTHDPLDAMVLADRVVVVEDGRAVQRGTPAEVARSPRTDYVARLMGLNLYRGDASAGRVRLAGGGTLTAVDAAEGPVLLAFPPSAVSLHRRPPEGSARNTWQGAVRGLEQRGEVVRVEVAGSPGVLADVTTAAVADLDLALDAPVWVSVKATEVHSYPA
jgi:molybdate transport system ATP-binding protein